MYKNWEKEGWGRGRWRGRWSRQLGRGGRGGGILSPPMGRHQAIIYSIIYHLIYSLFFYLLSALLFIIYFWVLSPYASILLQSRRYRRRVQKSREGEDVIRVGSLVCKPLGGGGLLRERKVRAPASESLQNKMRIFPLWKIYTLKNQRAKYLEVASYILLSQK